MTKLDWEKLVRLDKAKFSRARTSQISGVPQSSAIDRKMLLKALRNRPKAAGEAVACKRCKGLVRLFALADHESECGKSTKHRKRLRGNDRFKKHSNKIKNMHQ